MATPPGTLDTSTLTPGPPTGSAAEIDATHWVAAEIVVGSGTQLTGLELEVARDDSHGAGYSDHGSRFRGSTSDRGGDDLAVSVWNASPDGLPGSEIESAMVSRLAKGSCSSGHLTEVDLFNPPGVTAGQKIFVVLGGLAAQETQRRSSSSNTKGTSAFEWCSYRGTTPQTLAISHNQGTTWGSTAGSGPQPLWRGTGGPAGAPVLGLADYVTSGPPSVTPEAPLSLLLPVVGAGTIGTALVVRRRRAVRRAPGET